MGHTTKQKIFLSHELEHAVKKAINAYREVGLSGKQKSQLEGILRCLEKKRAQEEIEAQEEETLGAWEEEHWNLQHSQYYM